MRQDTVQQAHSYSSASDVRSVHASGGYALRVQGVTTTASAQPGDTLVKAGLRAGIQIPHLCLVGDCGSCRCQLVKGKVRLKRDVSHHIDVEALRQGHVLACQSEALSDVELVVPGLSPNAGATGCVRTQGVIKTQKLLTHDITELVLVLDHPIHYAAGQYAQLTVPGNTTLADEPRCYSFAEAPQKAAQHEVKFHVRLVKGGAFTEWLFAAEREATVIELRGPLGDFGVRDLSRAMVCIAGGTGLAPIKAMLEDLCRQGRGPDVILFFGARTQRDLYCLENIAALQADWPGPGRLLFIPVLSMEPQTSGWSGLTGHIPEHLASFCNVADSSFYLCGPPAMVDAHLRMLKAQVDKSHIAYDRFLDRASMEGAGARLGNAADVASAS